MFAITSPVESGYSAGHGIANGRTAQSEWTLIPAPGLGGSDPSGTHYRISATYTYTMNGVQQNVTTAPVDITILPMPQLVVDYYVPRNLKANQPVKLGVVVRNVGDGPVTQLKIDSGQPQITENKSGLLINFALVGGSVGGLSVPTSGLAFTLGTIPAHGQAYGYWVLSTDGQMTAFTATYAERDYKGAKLSPLILAVHTNIIVEGDVVPAGGQVLQVVASDLNVDPTILLNLETGASLPVTSTSIVDQTTSPGTVTYCLAGGSGFMLAEVPDVEPNTPLVSVRAARGDGSTAELYTGNGLVWRGQAHPDPWCSC